jgi:hypothetical protein
LLGELEDTLLVDVLWRSSMLKVLVLAGALLVSPIVANAQSATDPTAFLNEVNKNNDKTLSLKEVDAYAAKKFRELNRNGTRTLSRQELGDRISDADFSAANTGHRKDQTLSKAEFMSYVDRLFKEANSRGAKTVSVEELSSPAGEKLITLLR